MNALVPRRDSQPSVLGERAPSLTPVGKIRPGIQVLTAAAANNERVVHYYNLGVERGYPFGYIGSQIQKKLKLERWPLRPAETPEYHARACDWRERPDVPGILLDMYGETREGDEHKKLYRFPVVFPFNHWLQNMPHEYACWSGAGATQGRVGSGTKKYFSSYVDGTRLCMARGKLEVDPRSKRHIRPERGIPRVPRPNDDTYQSGGLCVPEKCPEFQANPQLCRLSGQLLFTIPGVQSGTGIVAVPTTSFYGLEQVRSQLELVEALRGSCAGTMDDGRPLFYLTKRERAVSHINLETGESEKRNHWIIHLETAFDLSGVRPTLPAPDDEEPFGETDELGPPDSEISDDDFDFDGGEQ